MTVKAIRHGRARTALRMLLVVVLAGVMLGACTSPAEPPPATATASGTSPATSTPPTAATRSPTPAPTRTPAVRAATASPIPRAATPGPLSGRPVRTFQFGTLVSRGDRAVIEEGVSLAEDYLETIGYGETPAVTIYAYVSLSELRVPWEGIARAAGASPWTLQHDLALYFAQTFPGAVLINTGAEEWQGLSAVHQLRVAAHEYFHAVQVALIGRDVARAFYSGAADEPSVAGPHWLVEGSADYISWRAMEAAGLSDLTRHVSSLRPEYEDLEAIGAFVDFYAGGEASYDHSLRAIFALMIGRDVGVLIDYFERLGEGQPWPAAFEASFGRSVQAFYAEYRGLFPQ